MFSRKALDSLAGRDSGEPQRFREQAQREIDALNDAFNKKITDLEQVKYIFSSSLNFFLHFQNVLCEITTFQQIFSYLLNYKNNLI